MKCLTCGRTSFENGGKLAGHLVMVHGVSSGEAPLRTAQMLQEQKDGPPELPPPPPPRYDDNAGAFQWRKGEPKPPRIPITVELDDVPQPEPEPLEVDMRAATRPCGCPRLGRHLKACSLSPFYEGEKKPVAAPAATTKARKPKKRARKAPSRLSRKVVPNGNGHKPPIPLPPEANGDAISLLKSRLEEEKVDLEAQLKVVNRLLDRAVALVGGER